MKLLGGGGHTHLWPRLCEVLSSLNPPSIQIPHIVCFLQVFEELKAMDYGHITVFYCGNDALGKILKNLCQKYHFGFKKENF